MRVYLIILVLIVSNLNAQDFLTWGKLAQVGTAVGSGYASGQPIKLNKPPEATIGTRSVYIGSLVLNCAYGGMVDAMIHNRQHNYDHEKIAGDFTYLGGFAITTSFTAFGAWNHKGSFWRFALDTIAGLLIGSVAWDNVYGEIQYGDAGKPYKKWYYNMGFGNHQERLYFDIGRVIAGILLILLPVN